MYSCRPILGDTTAFGIHCTLDFVFDDVFVKYISSQTQASDRYIKFYVTWYTIETILWDNFVFICLNGLQLKKNTYW